MKIRVCGPKTARKVIMMRVWKEVKEKEAKGEFADYKEITGKHWAKIRPKLEKKICFDEEV